MSLTIVFLQIKWENRFHGYHGRSCLVTVYGTDFWICGLKPLTQDFYSHKFVKGGLHYEVGVCIRTGLIVWINGPFVVGKYNDITIFQSKMIYELLDWEMVQVDQGYVGQLNKIHMKYELGVSENHGTCGTTWHDVGNVLIVCEYNRPHILHMLHMMTWHDLI